MKVFLVCFLAATFLWLMTALNKDSYSLKLDYPIHFDYDESEYIPIEPLPKSVSVNVSGNGWNLLRKSWLRFAQRPLEYRVGNPLKANFINTASLKSKLIEHFPDVQVNYVIADTLELYFERKITRIIPIRVDSMGIDIRSGYVISSLINLSPSLISVEGPTSMLRAYPDTIVVRIPMRKIQNNFDETLSLDIPKVRTIEVSHSDVSVSFEVARILRGDTVVR